jgi:hypothetical protein
VDPGHQGIKQQRRPGGSNRRFIRPAIAKQKNHGPNAMGAKSEKQKIKPTDILQKICKSKAVASLDS